MAAPGDLWQPTEQGTVEICSLLLQHLHPGADVTRIFQELQRFSQIPDFSNYLAYILTTAQGQLVEVRQSAGLLLKNHLKASYATLQPSSIRYVRGELLRSIGAEDPRIRSTVGTVISMLVEQGGLETWPDLLAGIAQCLESNDFNHTEGALDALYKMCEDTPAKLDSEVPGLSQRPINLFLPRLIQLFQSPHANFRRMALGSTNHFLILLPEALVANMDAYLQGVFTLASDKAPEVRKLACSAIVQMTECRSEMLAPHMRGVVEFILRASRDPDPTVALQASEFWTAFCDSQQPPEVLREFLPQLLSTLLSNMVYADDDETLIEAEEEGNEPDTDQDLKPRFHQPKTHGAGDEDDEAYEDDGNDDDEATVWNLRKCSAAGLDTLSHTFGDELLPALLPLIQMRLANGAKEQWREREAGVLALGAISEGCISGLLDNVPQLVQHLLPLLGDEKPLIRSITCWTVSRYSKWIVMKADQPEGQVQFDAVLMGFLERILDNNKRVQEAACSAFATLEEEGVELLPARLEPILQHLTFAFGKYQRRNMRILYDALGTLAECVGAELRNPKYLEMVMPPLTRKWGELTDVDRDILPLLECLTSVSQALGPVFSPYAEPIFTRCCNIIRVQLLANADPARAGTSYEREFIVCALDLLAGLVETLGSSVEPLVAGSDLRDLVVQCCSSDAPDVRQSAFALVGDLAKACPSQLRPRLGDILSLSVAQLHGQDIFEREKVSVANNACWAVGEIAIKLKREVAPVILSMVSAMVPLLTPGQRLGGHRRALTENCAITLGRLAVARPGDVASHLAHFLLPWVQTLRIVRDDVEKEDAFFGLCAVLRINPMAATHALPAVFQAVGSWRVIKKQELCEEIRQLLHGFKKMLVDMGNWEQFTQSIEPPLMAKLAGEYGL